VDGFAAEEYAHLQIGILGAVIGWEEDEETEILPRGPREEAETEAAGNFAQAPKGEARDGFTGLKRQERYGKR
jgi:hypothetical protein